jgi:predicted nucleic acid-binding protein
MEVMVGCKNDNSIPKDPQTNKPDESHPEYASRLAAAEACALTLITSKFTVLAMDDITADLSVEVRKRTNKHLPDTVIHAPAILHAESIVTRNVTDFPTI